VHRRKKSQAGFKVQWDKIEITNNICEQVIEWQSRNILKTMSRPKENEEGGDFKRVILGCQNM
jgi:hypothetical protein